MSQCRDMAALVATEETGVLVALAVDMAVQGGMVEEADFAEVTGTGEPSVRERWESWPLHRHRHSIVA